MRRRSGYHSPQFLSVNNYRLWTNLMLFVWLLEWFLRDENHGLTDGEEKLILCRSYTSSSVNRIQSLNAAKIGISFPSVLVCQQLSIVNKLNAVCLVAWVVFTWRHLQKKSITTAFRIITLCIWSKHRHVTLCHAMPRHVKNKLWTHWLSKTEPSKLCLYLSHLDWKMANDLWQRTFSGSKDLYAVSKFYQWTML